MLYHTNRSRPQQQQQLHHKLYRYYVIPAALICSSSNNYITNWINIVLYRPLSSTAATTTSQAVSTSPPNKTPSLILSNLNHTSLLSKVLDIKNINHQPRWHASSLTLYNVRGLSNPRRFQN